MARKSKKQQEIMDGALEILANPDSFCKNHYFKYRGPLAKRNQIIDPSYREGFNVLQEKLQTIGATTAEPNFQVCGEGAIYVSAAIQGYTYDDAYRVCENVADGNAANGGVGYGIPEVNDAKGTTREDVREYLSSWGRKLLFKGQKVDELP